MKRVLKFVGLKIVELSAIIFIPYGIGRLACCFPKWMEIWTYPTHFWMFFAFGILHLIGLFLSLACIVGLIVYIWEFIKLNWKWAAK